jgi:putative ABC transport system permease protein
MWWQRRARREKDLDDELKAHLELDIQHRMDRGQSREQARVDALRAIRSVDYVKEEIRSVWTTQYAKDLRLAFRSLRSGGNFTLAVLLMLSLGIGATTAMFSVVNGVLLRPLALPDSDQVVLIGESMPQMPQTAGLAWFDNLAAFSAWQRDANDFAGMALIIYSRLPVMAGSQPMLLHGIKTFTNLFNVLDVRPALGRAFQPGDDTDTSIPIIISDALWRSAFNSDPAIIGRDIGMPGSPVTVIGVLPEGFQIRGREFGPMFEGSPAEFFRPLQMGADAFLHAKVFSDFDYHVIGRLRSGVTRTEALAQLNVIQANLARSAPEKLSLYADLITMQDFAVAGTRQELWLLLAGAGLVLLIVSVNLGGLWISRVADRYREWGIRAALGAAPRELARQLLFEGILLGLIGGCLGVACAAVGLRTLLAAAPANLPRLAEVSIDWRVLVLALALSLAAGFLTGVVPALRLGRLDPQTALRYTTGNASSRVESTRSRQTLIVVQAALSTVLLAAVGLLGLSLYRLVSEPVGFVAQHAAQAEVSLIDYSNEQRFAILRQLSATVLALPGVSQAGFTTQLPLTGERGLVSLAVPGKTYTDSGGPQLTMNAISPGYLAALGVPLLAGRDLSESDRNQNAIVISAAALHALWPEAADVRDIVGREIAEGDTRFNVVGVAADVRTHLTEPAPPVGYTGYWFKGPPYSGSLVVRSSLPVGSLAGPLRQAIGKLAPAAPMSDLQPLDQLEANAVAPQRYQVTLLVLFAGLALFLAALGVYSLVAHSVARRSKELAIRISLGADAATIWSAVMRQALGPPVLGLAFGLFAAVCISPLLRPLLFRVRPINATVLVTVAATVGIAAICACLGPARRATRVDPMRALKVE